MGSWKSSSSKGLLDSDALLDLEDQLDYEPDGLDHEEQGETDDDDSDDDQDVITQVYNKNNQKYSQHFSEGKQDYKEKKKDYLQEQDYQHELPEPSGQEDQESSNQTSSERHSFSYGTDLENAPSVTSNYRDKINYSDQHADVEKDSCISKFGQYSKVSESYYLNSSDDEDEDESTDGSNGNNTPSREYENMVSPNSSPISIATKEKVDNSVALSKLVQVQEINSPQGNYPVKNSAAVVQPKKRAPLNFSIQVTGNERVYRLPKTQPKRKPHRPWRSEVGEYLDDSDLLELSSRDDLIRFPPGPSYKPNIKNRLGHCDSNSQTSESGSNLSLFKMPLKRPPTRQKGKSKNLSVSIDLRSRQKTVTPVGPLAPLCQDSSNSNDENKDDIISLIASSCQLDAGDELDDNRDQPNNIFVKDEPFSFSGSSAGTERAKRERTALWVSNASEPIKVDRGTVPTIYKGLCFNYFFNNRCHNKVCNRSHFLISPQTQIKQLPLLTTEELEKAYSFAKEHPFLYGQIYKYFAEAFAQKGMESELVNMVHIIFEESSHQIDKIEGLSAVLSALQTIKLKTFEDSVEYLLLQIGVKRYPNLGSILLEIICKIPDLAHHWPLVRRLVIAGEKMSDKLGAKFLIHLMKSPVNLDVCQETYRHIRTYNFIDLPKIPADIRETFLKLCSEQIVLRDDELAASIERNLSKERFNFERTVQTKTTLPNQSVISSSNQPIQVDFSVPPPKLPSFGRTQVSCRDGESAASIERNISKERFNFEKTVQNKTTSPNQNVINKSNQPIQIDFSVPPPKLSGFGRIQVSSSPSTTLNYVPPMVFGSDVSHQLDFSSLSRQEPSVAVQPNQLTCPLPVFNVPPPNWAGRSNTSSGSHHDVDLRSRSSTSREEKCATDESSEDEHPSNGARFSDSDSSASSPPYNPILLGRGTIKRPVGLMYNKEGLQYDPANDYAPRPKRRQFETQSKFHRFEERNVNQTDQDRGQGSRLTVQGVSTDQSEPPVSAFNPLKQGGRWVQRANRNFNETAISFQRPYHNVQGAGEALQKTNRKVGMTGQAFQRTSHNVEAAGPAFPRMNHNVEGQGLSSRNHNASTAQAFLRTNHNLQRPGPTAQNANSRNRADMPVRGPNHSMWNNEAAVSSSSDAKLRDEKTAVHSDNEQSCISTTVSCGRKKKDGEVERIAFAGRQSEPTYPPEDPQFGILYFDPNYEFNVSLHNLYLEAIDNVDIDEGDVHKLNDCVKFADGKTFLELIEKYKGPKTVQNFVSMTLAHLKGMNQLVAKTYQGLLDTIEGENPSFYGTIYIRVILEVITMNLLFELHQRNMLDAANNFLNKFSNWDSLVTSRLFINSSSKEVSIIGRYLFIARILNNSKPELTYEILVCPTLHLLEKYEKWPYHPPCPIPEIFTADLEFRNAVIVNFLKTGYLLNTVVVIQLYKTAFRGKIWNLNVKPYVDLMIIDIIRKDLIISLKQINNEISIFYKYMSNDTLRAFLITMYKHLSERESFQLYDKCVERKIYQRVVSGESMEYTIEIKTNLQPSEIELIIKYYFSKLSEIKKVPPKSESLMFVIKAPGEPTSKSLPFLNNYRTMIKTAEILTQLLQKVCSVKSRALLPDLVEVEKQELVNYLDRIWT